MKLDPRSATIETSFEKIHYSDTEVKKGEQKYFMARGDAQRVWFTEMKDMLAAEYNSSLSLEDFIMLTDRLDAVLQKIRSTRNIIPPMIWCPRCKVRGRAATPKVSVRAAILALGRFGIAPEDEVKSLERQWKKYQKEQTLDRYGKKSVHSGSGPDNAGCHGE